MNTPTQYPPIPAGPTMSRQEYYERHGPPRGHTYFPPFYTHIIEADMAEESRRRLQEAERIIRDRRLLVGRLRALLPNRYRVTGTANLSGNVYLITVHIPEPEADGYYRVPRWMDAVLNCEAGGLDMGWVFQTPLGAIHPLYAIPSAEVDDPWTRASTLLGSQPPGPG